MHRPDPTRWRVALTVVVLGLAAACTATDDPPLAPTRSGGTPVDPHRPEVHLTPEHSWMNDPQRPFLLDGRWHLYYLYNEDHPGGNGTAWFHATSTDLVHWQDEGIAIDKYRNDLGDIQTGSAVVDTANTAGFGAGAVVALVTQQHDGVQRQSLFYSTDGGYSFEEYAANPVLDNPGATHWRDPKVVWDEERGHWVMALAEGHKIGFYTSPDLKSWRYRSGFERTDLGLLECPDLFRMSIDGDPDRTTWVLGASANGAAHGRTTGFAYWTGTWDGARFTPSSPDPAWLDSGADFYAAVTWDDSSAVPPDRLASRYAIGWMNNWAYAGDLPLDGWAGGQLSTVRELSLIAGADGRPRLRSRPVDAVEGLEGTPRTVGPVDVNESAPYDVPTPGPPYRLRISIVPDPETPAREVRLRITEDVTVGFDLVGRSAFLVRRPVTGSGLPDSFEQVLSDRVSVDGELTLDVLVDRASVEAFVNDGERAFSALSFGAGAPHSITIETVGGGAGLRDTTIVRLSPAPPARS